MANFTKSILSGSINGKNIVIGTGSTPIHTSTSGTGDVMDEVWVWASNNGSTTVPLTIQYGSSSSGDIISSSLSPIDGPVLVIPGWLLQNNSTLSAYTSTSNVVVVNGYVNKIA